jgi:hypothetical protein
MAAVRVYSIFRTGRLERELQMIQLSATRCSYIPILCFAATTLCVAFQRVFVVVVVVVYFVINSVRKLLDTPSYVIINSERLSDFFKGGMDICIEEGSLWTRWIYSNDSTVTPICDNYLQTIKLPCLILAIPQ